MTTIELAYVQNLGEWKRVPTERPNRYTWTRDAQTVRLTVAKLDGDDGMYEFSEYTHPASTKAPWSLLKACRRQSKDECYDLFNETLDTYKRIGWKQMPSHTIRKESAND